jgi:localization factor PodJL
MDAMTSNVPWSVKGIERDARETAKAAAQREGMTLGEWLNQMIYAVGDPNAAPPAANDIDGLKARDIATAFEHLTRRIAGAEAKSADSVESLARSLGGVVERLQRMERARNPGETPPDLLERVETLEAKAGDRTRIDALRALEKAVSQVAQQFASTQAGSLARLDAVERSMQSIAGRLDSPAAGGVSAETMREAFEQMAGRIERAERVAQEAARLKAEAGDSGDAEFVQKTGLRLRILGDEIKRGGDQIKTLEGSISRLAQQIDAAERRSAEGIQKVAETIAELRTEVAAGDGGAEARADIEAAVSEITQRTEDRITALQRSFDEMVRRLDGAARPAAATTAHGAHPAPQTAPPRAAALAAPPPPKATRDALDDEFDSVFADLEAAAAPAPTSPEASDDLDFDLGEAPLREAPAKSSYDSDTNDVLAEIREAFGIDPPAPRPAVETETEEDAEAADTGLELDEEPPVIAAEAEPVVEPAAAAAGAANADYLKAARLAAREAAARAAAETDGKRKLTPKQRAILAARAKRRRLEEEARDRDGAAKAAAPLVAEQPAKLAAAETEASPLKSRISAAIAKLKSARPAPAPAAKQGPTLDEPDAEAKAGAAPALAGGAADAIKKFRAMPMSRAVIGVGIGIVLLAVALFVLTKDLLKPKAAPVADAQPVNAAPDTAPAPVASTPAPAVRDDAAADDLVRPRDLYLQNITALKSAETDAEARAALAEIEKAAALGHPPAQLQLGELYKIGQIYEKDLASARQWFERAANGGNVLAMHRLGVMSARGEGGPVDPAGSIAWFEKAASFGLLDSQYNLGATYHPTTDGATGGIQNAGLAYYWYSVAAKNGDAQAAEMAAGLSATLSPAERAAKDAEAAAWTAQNADPIANELQPTS